VHSAQTRKTDRGSEVEQDKAPGLLPAANHIVRQRRSGISPKHCGSCKGFGIMPGGVVKFRLALRTTPKPAEKPKTLGFMPESKPT